MRLKIRPLRKEDGPGLDRVLRAQGHFKPAEVEVAWELIELGLNQPGQSDYYFRVGEGAGEEILGYTCYGKTPLTDAVYDLYWIVVHPACGRQGVGAALLGEVENDVRRRRARRLFIETSSLPAYDGARTFYRRLGYREEARLLDFYSPGDHKLIFGKTFLPGGAR